ncbi:UvrD-helicase domain-containing protein [Parabacteroides sp. OttesenSCG-928-N08]|nr:UvrD-helicase domain-containing protein [Parabacteroides sp. OttesenSCG-928-N08]
MEIYLNQLNESQRAAVEYNEGPALVIAGAGSGKTRVLTYKIAYLLQQGLPPYSILALTFTNKAAREMKERIATLTDEQTARRLWMGTFHSIFARILRFEAAHIGYPSDFTIYDAADSKSLIRSIIKEMKLDDKAYRPGVIQSRISNAKNALVTWQAYQSNKELVEYDRACKMPLLREIYKIYQTRCHLSGAMDFDDLLMQTNILFRDHPDVLEKYRNYFRYVLVDEYQDTNFSQHLIIQRLCEQHGKICVVGDDAQSIYSFRGANIDNILKFRNNYPNAKTFKLERNYRSTQTIVDAANSLIKHNEQQIPKKVFSEKEKGNKIQVIDSFSDYEEAFTVSDVIARMQRDKRYDYADFALLYRTNAQSRSFEEAMRKKGIPYKIYGGLSFYQRKEIKDIISYFRLVVNPRDEEAFKRIVNYPKRGIGDTTVGKLLEAATTHQQSIDAVLSDPLRFGVSVNSGTAKKLSVFRQMIDSFREQNNDLSLFEMAELILRESGMLQDLAGDTSVEGISRKENMEELLKGIEEYSQIRLEEGVVRPTMSDYLSEVALLTDQDNDKEENMDKVTLMTVHAAKGLEFKNVFVVGLEENLFPSQMAMNNPRELEEERRLFYVAITRAEENCFLSYARSRFRHGETNFCSPSSFIYDIDPCYLELPSDMKPRQTVASPELFQRRFSEQPRVEKSTSTYSSSRLRKIKAEEKSNLSTPSAAASEQSSGSSIKVGDRINHSRFGDGTVKSLEGSGVNQKALIEFDHAGERNLLLKYAKLTLL